MNQVHKILLSQLFLVFFYCTADAQIVNITNLEQNGESISIKYTITAIKSNQEQYSVALYSSADEYKSEIQLPKVQSQNISPGQDLKLTFNGQQVFGGYEGDINFKILITKTFAPLEFVYPKEETTIRVGKTLKVVWDGGTIHDFYNLEYKSGLKLNTPIGESLNQKTYNWTIPEDQTPGTYNLRLSSNSGNTSPILSGNVVIKKKIPLVIKLAPAIIAAAGVGTYFILNSGSEGGTESIPTNIQDPPDPPTN